MPISDPVAIALMFCDNLIEEKNTNKKTLIGVFSAIFGERFPLQFRPFWIYASFTNVIGEHSFTLNIVSDETKAVLVSVNGHLDSKDLGAVIELTIPIKGIVLPKPGKYGITLHVDGSDLLSRVISVKQVKKD